MVSILDQRSGDPRRDGDFPIERARVSLGTVVTAVIFIAGLLATYFASVSTVNARVSVLESQVKSQDDSLKRIETKVDRLLERRAP